MLKKMLCPFFIFIFIFTGCAEIHEEIFVQIYPIEGYRLVQRAMFTSNNGYTRELYFTFKNAETGKNTSILALIKPTSTIVEQATGRALTVADITPGTFAALYFSEADFAEGVPKKAQAMRVVVLADQVSAQTPQTQDCVAVNNAVIERVSNNTVTVLLSKTLEQPQFMTLYITPSSRFYGENGQLRAYTTLKRGSICTLYIPEKSDIYGRNMLKSLVVTS